VIQHAQLHARRFADVELVYGLLCLQQTQEMKYAVEHTHVVIGRDGNHRLTVHAPLPDDVTLCGEAFQPKIELRDLSLRLRSADEQRAG
jgi:hypothetical protein